MPGQYMEKIRVLVTDAGHKNALAAVRSLGKKGIKVDVSGRSIFGQAFYSKYCNRRFLYPDPRNKTKDFINLMIKIVRKNRYDVLLPIGASTTLPISYYKDKFEQYTRLPIAEYDVLIKAHDKPTALKIAKDCGIPIPQTYFPRNKEEVRKLSKEITYPAVIKLRRGSSAIGLRYANSPEELIRKYFSQGQSNFTFDYEFPMIQEYIPGEVHDVCVLFNKGEPRAVLTQKRIRMNPPTGGGGVVNETTDEPNLKKMAVQLLKKMRWHGPAQVEFKIDSRDETPKLMEVNAKFWGTLDLSIQAGIDFPYLACKMAIDGDVFPVYNYKVGLKYRWLLHELRSITKVENKWKSFREFFIFEKGVKYDIWLRDLVPNIVAALVFATGFL